MKGTHFEPVLFTTFKEFVLKDFKLDSFVNESKIHMTEIEEGLSLSRPLFNLSGKVLLSSEYIITKNVIDRIFKHHELTPIKNPLNVYAKTPVEIFNFEEVILKKFI